VAPNVAPAELRRGYDLARTDLYWLPLGAGRHSVRLNGRVFEALRARNETPNPVRQDDPASEAVDPAFEVAALAGENAGVTEGGGK
jgi:hypothetical protein